jgi:anti-anti-sigma factor
VERSSGAAPPPQPGGGDPAALSVRVEDTAEGTSIVAIAGELDLSTIPRMQAPLLEQIGQRSAVLVDLSGLSFIDSSGIGILIQALRSADGTPVHILIAIDSQVDRVFRITGISDALPVFTDRERALTWARNHDQGNGDGG